MATKRPASKSKKKKAKPKKAAKKKKAVKKPAKKKPAKKKPAKKKPAKKKPAKKKGLPKKKAAPKKKKPAKKAAPKKVVPKKKKPAPKKKKQVKADKKVRAKRPVEIPVDVNFDLNTKVQRQKDVAWRMIEGEAVIVTPADSTMHTLNDVGTRIWELMTGNRSIREVAGVLCTEFEVDRDRAEKDTLWFAECLAKKGLVKN